MLNRNWEPVNLISARQALSMLLQGQTSKHASADNHSFAADQRAAWLNLQDMSTHTKYSPWAVMPLSPSESSPRPDQPIARINDKTEKSQLSKISTELETELDKPGHDKTQPPLNDAGFIASPTLKIRVPHAIILTSSAQAFARYGNKSKPGYPRFSFARRTVLQRDKYRCAYCGAHATTVDHIVPKSAGGESSFQNCVACCERCNSKKASKSLAASGLKLRKGISLREPDPKAFRQLLVSRYEDHWSALLAMAQKGESTILSSDTRWEDT